MFILISGWFGIKGIWRQVVRLAIDCAIYSAITNSVCVLALGYPFEMSEFVFSCFFKNNWFVISFMMLVISAPMLESVLNNVLPKQLAYYIVLLTVLNVVFGFGLRQINTNGYNYVNFIYLYFIGRFMHVIADTTFFQKVARHGLLIWLVSSLLLVPLFIGIVYWHGWGESLSQNFFAYNNPLILVSSIAFFAWFSKVRVQSERINTMGRGVFGVFLLHTTSMFIVFRKDVIGGWYQHYGYIALFAAAIALFLICLTIAFVIEKIKSPLYNRIFKTIHI